MSFTERILQFFLPKQCPCCDRFLDENENGVCQDCLSGIRWIEPPFCSICGMPFLSRDIETHLCGDCMRKKRYFTIARAVGVYEGTLKKAIHQWKYEGKDSLTPFFVDWIIGGIYRYWPSPFFDLLIPVPLHKSRLRHRGFNQALLLVKQLSKITRIPYAKKLLVKNRPSIPQVDLSVSEREKGLAGNFWVVKKEDIKGKRILLIDDVYTTGATVNECSKTLIMAGAKSVDVLTLAHTIKNI